jgi:N-acetylmuramoyl-L-alanine amidase
LRASVAFLGAAFILLCGAAPHGGAAASAGLPLPFESERPSLGHQNHAPPDGDFANRRGAATALLTSSTSAAPLPQVQDRPLPIPDATLEAQRLPATFLVIIDPGHGGDDHGTRGAGVVEKELTLDVARRLQALLGKAGDVGVVMTRDTDVTLDLDARIVAANAARGNLLLSLHANSAPTPAASGAEVYSLQLDQTGEQVRRRIAAAAVNVTAAGSTSRSLAVLPWDYAQAPFVDDSATLAAIVVEQLRARVPIGQTPRRQAPLRVTQQLAMPAVLVEMAYLSNPVQAKLAASQEFRDSLAQALFDSVVRFRAGPGGTNKR